MESLLSVFYGEAGKIVSFVLVAVGMIDIAMTRIPLFPLCKKKLELLKKSEQTFAPEEKSRIEKNLKGILTLEKILTAFGAALIALGIFGLTR